MGFLVRVEWGYGGQHPLYVMIFFGKLSTEKQTPTIENWSPFQEMIPRKRI